MFSVPVKLCALRVKNSICKASMLNVHAKSKQLERHLRKLPILIKPGFLGSTVLPVLELQVVDLIVGDRALPETDHVANVIRTVNRTPVSPWGDTRSSQASFRNDSTYSPDKL